MEDMGEGDASCDIRPFEERCEAHATAAAEDDNGVIDEITSDAGTADADDETISCGITLPSASSVNDDE